MLEGFPSTLLSFPGAGQPVYLAPVLHCADDHILENCLA